SDRPARSAAAGSAPALAGESGRVARPPGDRARAHRLAAREARFGALPPNRPLPLSAGTDSAADRHHLPPDPPADRFDVHAETARAAEEHWRSKSVRISAGDGAEAE